MLGDIGGIVTALAGLGLLLYLVGVWNSHVALDRSVQQLFSNVDVVLKQRHDELRKLVDSCRAYMHHEQDTLEAVTRLRAGFETAAGPVQKVLTENALNAELAGLGALIEAYPTLRADAQFRAIQARISALDTLISERREQFNQAVTHYNVFIGEFPVLLVARLLGWRQKPWLAFSPAQLVDVSLRP